MEMSPVATRLYCNGNVTIPVINQPTSVESYPIQYRLLPGKARYVVNTLLPSTQMRTNIVWTRLFLRAGQHKPGFLPRIRDEFRQNAQIPKIDVMHIEYLYRRAQRQLDQLKDVNTKQLGTFVKPKHQS
ncbi:hypothetical protein SKAU_G00271290 [Synaphobranchus kaupii]|uniref:Uncharacterized protein n=1 Tax=Synaphobranchus kaupii TaxID=118154 RepID=A0A9Q1IPP6_SYNKA|nr:hypothetical protein SKAU_G00271290 [Synaphobranchus kaupii]